MRDEPHWLNPNNPELPLSEHDLGVLFLAKPALALALAQRIATLHAMDRDVTVQSITFAHPIQKPEEGKLGAVIGFIDLVITCAPAGTRMCRIDDQSPDRLIRREPDGDDDGITILVVVMTQPVSLSKILHTIKMYDVYIGHRGRLKPEHRLGGGPYAWIAATRDSLPNRAVSVLCSEDIEHVVLGQKFEAWVAAQRCAADVGSPEA